MTTVQSTVEIDPIELTAGDFYSQIVNFNGVDYSAITMTAQVRKSRNSTSKLLATFTIDDISYDSGTHITTVVMHLEEEDTRAIGDAGRGYWDMQLAFPAGTKTPFGGIYTIRQDVTA